MPLALAVFATVPFTPNVFAAQVEEVVVTAQRTEESIQDVPIAVSAFTGTMLEDKQIISPSDLQMNAPNVSFSATNFGSSSFSIRGIGRLVVSATGDSGVSFHVNEIALPTNLPALEFYDMQRVEVLRGPQGTLYGRNATGGVVDMITNKPNTEAFSGNVDLEGSNYDGRRAKGALNIPLTDTFAIRLAGIRLKRDGYIDNTASGQVGCASQTGFDYKDPNTGAAIPCKPQTLPGIHNTMDGRDMYSFRITALWNPTENSSAWVMYSKFYENDDKVRINNQVCESNPLPVTGCTANGFGFDAPSNSATTGGMFMGLNGGFLLGLQNPTSGYPVYKTGFRRQHTDFQPVYKYNEEAWEFNYQYNFNKFSVILDGGYLTDTYLSQQDYNVDVGYNIATTAFGGPQDTYPSSQPAGFASKDWTSGKCNFNDGTSGIFGGCVYPNDGSRGFAYDQSDSEGTYWTAEGRLQSSFDGFFNFLVGVNYAKSQYNGDYYVVANSLDIVGTYGVPRLGFPPLYPTMFDATGAPNGGTEGDSWAYFGEAYFQITDKFKITAGLRYNDDTKQVQDSSVLFNSFTLSPTNAPGQPVFALRNDLAPFFNAATMVPCLTGAATCTDAQNQAIALGNLYGTTQAYLNATNILEVISALALTPPAPGYNEQRILTGSPKKADWQETTGRIGFDWNVLDDTMVYGFYTRGYKPGGFNPPLNAAFVNSGTAAYTFAPEKVDAYEIGSKSTFLGGGMTFNTAFFYYKYKDLQVSRIANNTSVNGNMDADIYGAEVETFYVPDFLPNLTIDLAYSYLHTEIVNSTAVDPLDRGAGDPNFVTLKNIDPGSLTGVSYVADVRQITPALVQQAYAQCGALASAADGNANTTCATWTDPSGATVLPVIPVADGTVYPATNPLYAGIPAYFSQGFLTANGVTTSDGFQTDLDGNQLPSSPKNTIHVGAAYAIQTGWGTFTPRVDYYWQGDMYAREFNTKGDYIDSWDQWNASVLYTSTDGRWEAKAWIRNIRDDDNITGKYLTSDTSGFFRNYFMTEPRVYGASVKYSFGAMD